MSKYFIFFYPATHEFILTTINISYVVFIALKEIDKKKNRKRNLISANVGVFTLYFMCVYGSIQMVLYTIPIDLGTRQFIVSLIADLGMCIITPTIVLYNAPVIRSQFISDKFYIYLLLILFYSYYTY